MSDWLAGLDRQSDRSDSEDDLRAHSPKRVAAAKAAAASRRRRGGRRGGGAGRRWRLRRGRGRGRGAGEEVVAGAAGGAVRAGEEVVAGGTAGGAVRFRVTHSISHRRIVRGTTASFTIGGAFTRTHFAFGNFAS